MPVTDVRDAGLVLHAPAADRNRAPILAVLQRVLPQSGLVLEIASGTGQHVAHFAAALPHLQWQPSDPDPAQRASIRARLAGSGLDNVAEPIELDVLGSWPALTADAIIVANLLHVSAPDALPALCAGAGRVLSGGGLLHVYGPFRRNGAHTSTGNARFDRALRLQNPAWGIRNVEDLLGHAAEHGLGDTEVIAMPANNLSVICRRSSQ